ncbi:hypothetical protein BK126_14795 [Paenibacillus sp. FSL H7-0326]|uniref:hypothetical protein n=1 Tax=Paenibacillus sp. FSL H7-0326 TaxID=1921144 RepID=UPI00096DEC51|nr:hypothetical protein [Paenibacillus sp. FSL H7-0326]OMC69048.1 hypothetical protein BK126_14795 [Paenibacillus sp. FSL H7-0326]
MKIIYSLLGGIVTAVALYLCAYQLMDVFYYSSLPDRGPGSFPGLSAALAGIYLFPVVMLVIFILFLIVYNKINIRGIWLGGAAGLWLYSLLMTLAPSQVFNYLPIIAIISGYILIQSTLSDRVLNWTLFGAACSWLVTYLVIIGGRAVQNTLTSYFYFSPSQQIVVLAGILVLGIVGWLIGMNKSSAQTRY